MVSTRGLAACKQEQYESNYSNDVRNVEYSCPQTSDPDVEKVRHPAIKQKSIDQIADDLTELHLLGADTVLLDPFNGDPDETHQPEVAWQALATVAARVRHLGE